MLLKRLSSGLGILVAALVCLAFVLTPLASAQHLDLAPEADCAAAHGADEAGGEAAGEPDHHHHAQGCGSCHVHLIGPLALQVPAPGAARRNLQPAYAAGSGAGLPGELFRPPRS